MIAIDFKQTAVFVLFLTVGFVAGFAGFSLVSEAEAEEKQTVEEKPELKTPFTPLRIKIPLSGLADAPGAPSKLTRQNAICVSPIPFHLLTTPPTQFNDLDTFPLTPSGINPYELPTSMSSSFAETPTYTPVSTPEAEASS